jgi:diguanylate cyclase (GGDEF)-like protein
VLIDQASLFLAAGIGGAALTLTLLSGWLHNRAEHFLLSWMVGIAVLSLGVVLYALGPADNMPFVAAAFALEIAGFAIIHAGVRQFVGKPFSRWRIAVLVLMVPAVSLPILAGYDGFGLMLYNLLVAALLVTSAAQYWSARAEAPSTIAGLAILYGVTGLSFVLCGIVLLANADWSLGTRPDNWAEQINAITCIVAVTGVGALSLSLLHARAARRHQREAQTDALTGLLNRRALFEAMSADSLRQGDAVVVFDLDSFKSINDRHGHAVGDEVLRRFAGALRRNLRHTDLAARTGGEEFVLVMRDATPRKAKAAAERIRAALAAERIGTPTEPVSATSSAGVALAAASDDHFEAVLNRADMSLYRAKRAGRDQVAVELQAVA